MVSNVKKDIEEIRYTSILLSDETERGAVPWRTQHSTL